MLYHHKPRTEHSFEASASTEMWPSWRSSKSCQDGQGPRAPDLMKDVEGTGLAQPGRGGYGQTQSVPKATWWKQQRKQNQTLSSYIVFSFRVDTRRVLQRLSRLPEVMVEPIFADFKCSVTQSCKWPKPVLALVLLWVGGWTKMTSRCPFQSNICSSLKWNSTSCLLSNTSISDIKRENLKQYSAFRKKGEILILEEGSKTNTSSHNEPTARLGLYVLQDNLKIQLIRRTSSSLMPRKLFKHHH